MTKESKPDLKKITTQLLKGLEVEAKVEIVEEEALTRIKLETDEPGILIGYHGQTLASIQLLMAMMVYRQSGEWARIVVDVNDYREKREETLQRMALSITQKVKFSGEPQALPPMPPAERRIIHLALADDPEVETISEGEDEDRRVVVSLKKENEKS